MDEFPDATVEFLATVEQAACILSNPQHPFGHIKSGSLVLTAPLTHIRLTLERSSYGQYLYHVYGKDIQKGRVYNDMYLEETELLYSTFSRSKTIQRCIHRPDSLNGDAYILW